MNDNELLVHDGDRYLFLIEDVKRCKDGPIKAHVMKIVHWREDREPVGVEHYFTFSIGKDGHLRIYDGGDPNGEIHFLNKQDINNHCRLMMELYQWGLKVI